MEFSPKITSCVAVVRYQHWEADTLCKCSSVSFYLDSCNQEVSVTAGRVGLCGDQPPPLVLSDPLPPHLPQLEGWGAQTGEGGAAVVSVSGWSWAVTVGKFLSCLAASFLVLW